MPTSTPRVGIVVLNYNGEKVLPDLLRSLDAIEYPSFRVFLIDNASTDKSLDIVRSRRSIALIDITRNDSNLLFSGGNNVGIKRALELGAEYIFLLNNDTIVPPRLVTALVEFLNGNLRAGIAGPLIHFREPANTIWSAGGMVSTWWGVVRHRGIRQIDRGQFGKPASVDYVSGAALMIKKEVIDRIGLLDEGFPMYFEDTDYCFRARKAGYKCWYVPTEPLIHLVSFAAGGQASAFKVERRLWSGLQFFARHARWYQWPTIILGQLFEAIRVGILVSSGKTNSK